MGTIVEGGRDEVMDLVGQCPREAPQDAPRALTTITIDDRLGKPDRITEKVRSVEAKPCRGTAAWRDIRRRPEPPPTPRG